MKHHMIYYSLGGICLSRGGVPTWSGHIQPQWSKAYVIFIEGSNDIVPRNANKVIGARRSL